MSPLLKRVVAGMGANSYGQAVTILIQLASLPIFLNHWDLATYGVWLTLSAIPAYFSMADVGMATVAGNRMTMLMGEKDEVGANRVFQSAQLFILISCLLVAVVVLPLIIFAPAEILSSNDVRVALLALVLGVLISLLGGLATSAFKATQRYAIGTGVDVTSRMFEWLGGVVGLVLYGTFSAVAIGMLLVRIIALLGMAYLSTYQQSKLSWGVNAADKNETRNMIKPSMGVLSFTISSALSLQGFTLLTAHLLGPAAVAIFNTYRTMARVAVQISSVLSFALWPEFSRLYGARDFKRLRMIYIRSALAASLGAVLLSAVIYLVGPLLLQVWTHGKVQFIPSLISLLLLYAAIGGSWHVPRVLLLATNNHIDLGVAFLFVSILSVALAWPLGLWTGLQGLVWAMIAGESFMMLLCFVMVVRYIYRDDLVACELKQSSASG